jgi:chromosome segregation ATPase
MSEKTRQDLVKELEKNNQRRLSLEGELARAEAERDTLQSQVDQDTWEHSTSKAAPELAAIKERASALKSGLTFALKECTKAQEAIDEYDALARVMKARGAYDQYCAAVAEVIKALAALGSQLAALDGLSRGVMSYEALLTQDQTICVRRFDSVLEKLKTEITRVNSSVETMTR